MLKSLFAVVFVDVTGIRIMEVMSRRGICLTAFEVKAAGMGVLLPFKRKIQFWLEGNHEL